MERRWASLRGAMGNRLARLGLRMARVLWTRPWICGPGATLAGENSDPFRAPRRHATDPLAATAYPRQDAGGRNMPQDVLVDVRCGKGVWVINWWLRRVLEPDARAQTRA